MRFERGANMAFFTEISNYATYSGQDEDFHFTYNANSGGGQAFLGGRFFNSVGQLVSPETLDGKTAAFVIAYQADNNEKISIVLDDEKTKYEIKPRGNGSTSMKLGIGNDRIAPSKVISAFMMLPLTCGVKMPSDLHISILSTKNYWLQSMWLKCNTDTGIQDEVHLIVNDCVFGGGINKESIDSNGRYFKLDIEQRMRCIVSASQNSDIFDEPVASAIQLFEDIYTRHCSFQYEECNRAVQTIMESLAQKYPERYSGISDPLPVICALISEQTLQNTQDTDSIRQQWMGMENQSFIHACLDFMKDHALLTESVMSILQSKEQCASRFRHNSLNGILLRVNPNVPDDEQRKDSSGNPRYYTDKYPIGDAEYFVSSEWRPDREDARTSFIDWIFSLMQKIKFSTGYQSAFARNRILFGAPGTGKSYTLNHEKDELLADGGEYERVTFHPDYSYANFVGTYKPVPHKDSDGKDAITYSYVPGPFMRTYVKALQNSKTDTPKPFLLVIEEINRANVAAVFGDVFQLLDRGDNEVSEYPIQATEDIKKYLASPDVLGGSPEDYAEIRIPDNMFIWATMNSADQGVFPMDTAFKRRWDFTYLGIDDSETGIIGKKVILGQGEYRRIVEWNMLRKAINAELISYKVNEDKLMGPYFISKKNLPEGEMFDPAAFIRIFKNKVLMYLFDDAAKQKRPSLFAGCEEGSRTQYSKICKEFDTKGVSIFCESIRNKFIDVPGDDAE